MLSNAELKSIANYIFNNFSGSKVNLIDYIFLEIGNISISCNINISSLEESILTVTTSSFQQLIYYINYKININVNKKGIGLIFEKPIYYIYTLIKATNNDLIKKYSTMLDKIISTKSLKGFFYEELVISILNSHGLYCEATPKTNDFGIDLISDSIVVKIGNILNANFRLIGQIKCYNTLINKCHIIQFVKDVLYVHNTKSLFFKNNNHIQLIFISHKGFTDSAKVYSHKNNIILLDSIDLLDLSLDSNNINILDYIEKEYEHII